MRLYHEIAEWFHLFSAPEEYIDEAAAYRDALLKFAPRRPRTLLELGAGAGNNALHLKRDFVCTLTDLSPQMLALSETINPECEHLVGDMRTLRLGRTFDAVFVHDAVVYMTTEDDLRRAIETAVTHCAPGGVVLIAPDFVRETFRPSTDHGGNDGRDGDRRSVRYLEWVHDPDPDDGTYCAEYVCMLRDGDGPTRVVHDSHVEGLFSRATWERLLTEAGLEVHAAARPRDDAEFDEVFVGIRR